jgi:hypothetical protein
MYRHEVGDCESCEAHFHNRHHELSLGDGDDLLPLWAMGIQRQVFVLELVIFED